MIKYIKYLNMSCFRFRRANLWSISWRCAEVLSSWNCDIIIFRFWLCLKGQGGCLFWVNLWLSRNSPFQVAQMLVLQHLTFAPGERETTRLKPDIGGPYECHTWEKCTKYQKVTTNKKQWFYLQTIIYTESWCQNIHHACYVIFSI